MRKLLVGLLLCVICVIAVSVAGCGSGKTVNGPAETKKNPEKKPIAIRWSYDTPANGSMSIVPETFRKLVEADPELKAKVDIQLFPASQLYKPAEALDAVMRGDVEIILLANWYLSALSPKVTVFDLPFLFKDTEALNKFLASPLAQEIWAPLEAKGVKCLAAAATGPYSIICNKKEVILPGDVKGLKVRSVGDGSHVWLSVGASPIDLPAGDVFVAMQRGVIDAADLGPITVKERNLFEVTKFYLDTFIHSTVITQLANKKFWDGLPEDIRSRLWTHIKAAEKTHWDMVPKLTTQYIEEMKSKGVEVHKLTDAEREKWVQAVQPVYEKLGPKVGLDFINQIKMAQK